MARSQVSTKTHKSLHQIQNDSYAHGFTLACPQPCRRKGTVTHSRGSSLIAMPLGPLGRPMSGTKSTLTTAKPLGLSSSVESVGFLSKCECSYLVSWNASLAFNRQVRNSKLLSRVTTVQSFGPARQSRKGKSNIISLPSESLGCSPVPTRSPPCLSSWRDVISMERWQLTSASPQSQSLRSISRRKSQSHRTRHQSAMHLIHHSLHLRANSRSPALVTDGMSHSMLFCLAHIMACEYYIFLYARNHF